MNNPDAVLLEPGRQVTSIMNKSEQVQEGYFFFDPADPIYADHFPGNAVVPGSLIVQAFVSAAENVQGAAGQVMLENFRFKRFVSPGNYAYRMVLSAETAGHDRLQCSLYNNGDAVVTGTLRWN